MFVEFSGARFYLFSNDLGLVFFLDIIHAFLYRFYVTGLDKFYSSLPNNLCISVEIKPVNISKTS